MMFKSSLLVVLVLGLSLVSAQNCGCSADLCCSKWGWCGNSPDHCGEGCRQNCKGSGGGGDYGPIDNLDRHGKDIETTTASSAKDCQTKCHNNPACDSWSFDTCGNGCWLKAGLPQPTNRDCRAGGTINGRGNGGGGNGGGGGNDQCAYGNEQKYEGWNFFEQFNFYTGPDPTKGFVQYIDRGAAQGEGLINVNGNGQAYMGVDSRNRAPGGRRSVRLESKNRYLNNLIILDLQHMPGSICGTWPAYWTFGPNWPHSGEIDIIEGVNRESKNAITLHTKPGCTMGGGRDMSGTSKSGECNAFVNGNAGCGVLVNQANSYGDGFNSIGGGIYVMERSNEVIKVWFFPRHSIPADVLSGRPNPCNWGKPDAHFPLGGQCPSDFFGPQNIIFNITFCGEWAGAVFGAQGCGGNCNEWVQNNPEVFKESFWLVNSLRVLNR